MSYSPMMRQYLNTKEQYKDCILFYRLGDFYEMFFEDAETASRELDLVLTGRQCGKKERAPMCGVPYHAYESYVAKLIDKGYKVAIAEQMSDPALSKGLVDREVVRVITPGTVLSESILDEKENNYLAALSESEEGFGLCWCDISTGEFRAMQIKGSNLCQQLLSQLARIRPKELLVKEDEPYALQLAESATLSDEIYISPQGEGIFGDRACSENIRRHFGIKSEKAVGLASEDVPLLFTAVGAVLGYIMQTQKQDATHLRNLQIEEDGDCMILDRATIKNLEITETLFDRSEKGSLLGVLDRTKTAMGSRLMKRWLREPLKSCEAIDARLDAVELLTGDILLRNDLRESLKYIYDLERLTGRISVGTANARDMIALKTSLLHLAEIKALLKGLPGLLGEISERIEDFQDMHDELEKAIVEEPPFTVREGGLIKEAYSVELDELKLASRDSKLWIASLENKERERTGIKSLKVGFNRVFGYYIEITNTYRDMVPENYIRKQTLVSAERYITSEMKEVESKVLNAEVKINELEYKIFTELRTRLNEKAASLQKAGRAIAECDVLASFAEASIKLNYTRPKLDDGDEIIIKKGRHPVIETLIKDGIFVSNDLYINRSDASMLIITGPNMSGKSTYMRQLALIVLMAQAGCFVPAESARIGICDRIYTRIGASDNISMGQSTFFVEMSELAFILNTATPSSLVILDEIGRGTSTYDGLSIAWATVEKLAGNNKVRTLFATHYHELVALEGAIEGVKNLNVSVSERGGDIVFLHKIVEGSASRSYGIHVAQLAGVPSDVIQSAERKLKSLEEEAGSLELREIKHPEEPVTEQLSIFSPRDSELAGMVRNLDLMNIKPSEAIGIIEKLQEKTRQ